MSESAQIIRGLCLMLQECHNTLDRYANRQGSRRMKGKSFSQGTVDNSAQAGQHYPAVASLMSRVTNSIAIGRGFANSIDQSTKTKP